MAFNTFVLNMISMKLDILAFGAHPDDVELGAGGTIAKEVADGKKVGIVDLTRGELGTRGTPELRDEEAIASSRILGIDLRANLSFRDGFFQNDETHQMELVKWIRHYQPEIVLCNSLSDRHPDHGKASALASDACFLAGLNKVNTYWDGVKQEAWRPQTVYHYIQDRYLKPDLVIDVSEFMDQKMNAVKAFKSQFYDPNSNEPGTAISSKEFIDFLYARCIEFGRPINAKYAEGFKCERIPGINSLFELL
jgi:bacillithiol biosynthesis deacetylase BshB1